MGAYHETPSVVREKTNYKMHCCCDEKNILQDAVSGKGERRYVRGEGIVTRADRYQIAEVLIQGKVK